QTQRALEALLQIASETRVPHAESFPFRSGHFHRITRGIRIFFFDPRRVQKAWTKKNHLAPLASRHPGKVRAVSVVDEGKNPVPDQSRKTHARFFQIFAGHALHWIAPQNAQLADALQTSRSEPRCCFRRGSKKFQGARPRYQSRSGGLLVVKSQSRKIFFFEPEVNIFR